MRPQRNRVLHRAQPPFDDAGDSDSRAAGTRVQPPDPRIIEIRDAALTGALWGAVAALEKITDEDLALLAGVDGIAGEAAQWLLGYRHRDTERRRRMQEALHGWRQEGRRD
jgi:hypothetical protein